MEHPPDRIQFAAAPRVIAVLLGAAALFASFAYADSTGSGRLLLGTAALGCLGEALRCAVVRPVLAADEHGVEIAATIRRVVIPWSQVELIGHDIAHRRGAIVRSVHVDVGDTVHSVAAYRLGADPAGVVSALESVRPR